MPSKTFLNLPKEKQESLLDASFLEFSQKTFEKVKVVQLCKLMNIPRVTFYSYFTDLADLYSYLVQKLSTEVDDKSLLDTEVEQLLRDKGEFLKRLVESDQGQRVLFDAMKEDSTVDKIDTHILLSLARQYQLNLITFREFFAEYHTLMQAVSSNS